MTTMTREDLHGALKRLSLFNALDDRGLNANNIYFTRCVLRDYRRWDPGYGTTPYAKITAGGGYPIRRPPPKRRGRPRASLGAASE